MNYLVVSFVVCCLALALIDPVGDIVRHLVWRRRWKRDDMGTYRRYLADLERLQSETPKVCRTKRRVRK